MFQLTFFDTPCHTCKLGPLTPLNKPLCSYSASQPKHPVCITWDWSGTQKSSSRWSPLSLSPHTSKGQCPCAYWQPRKTGKQRLYKSKIFSLDFFFVDVYVCLKLQFPWSAFTNLLWCETISAHAHTHREAKYNMSLKIMTITITLNRRQVQYSACIFLLANQTHAWVLLWLDHIMPWLHM